MSGLSPMFSMGAVFRRIEKFADERRQRLIMGLAYVGENIVNEARDTGEYQDQTGNLRSSTGWVIIEKGKAVRQFGAIARSPGIIKSGKNKGKTTNRKVGTEGKLGVETGKEFIEWAEDEFKDEGLVLVVFAGMEYAAAVESKGYDVLTNSTYLGKQLFKELDLEKFASDDGVEEINLYDEGY